MGERELALGLLDYALKSFNLPEERSYAIMREVRKAGEGGAFDRRLAGTLERFSGVATAPER
jgi:CPA2 family monovalent cation:H+ antiporter-2